MIPPGFESVKLTINLDAIVSNWQKIDFLVGNSVDVGAVVKANAYGLGAEAVVSVLKSAGCKKFFVATVNEAISIHKFLSGCYIYVFQGPTKRNVSEFIKYGFVPILNDLEQIDIWSKQDEPSGPLNAIIHLDTGMSRLGLPPNEFEILLQNPHIFERINFTYIMSHLACAEKKYHKMNSRQFALFESLLRSLSQYSSSIKITFANSSGIFINSKYHYDLVRPGASLYGLNPTPKQNNPMDQVINLQAKIQQIRYIDTHQSVGYGASFVAKKGSRIATVPVGYADGYVRSASNRAHCFINGTKVPVVGRVSMDMITLDVTELPENLTHPGTPVELIGKNYSVDSFAADSKTIGYEILTSLGHRYQRYYVKDGKEREIN